VVWRCGLSSNLPKDIFSIKICSLDPGDQMLSQKILTDVGVDTSSAETGNQGLKSTRPGAHSACRLLSFLCH
jgi:hypothetical protein